MSPGDGSISKVGETFHTLFHFHIVCLCLYQWVLISHVTCLLPPELVMGENCQLNMYLSKCWNVSYWFKLDLKVVGHLQSLEPGWNHIHILYFCSGFSPSHSDMVEPW